MPLIYTKDLLAESIKSYGYEIGEFTYGRPIILSWREGKKLSIGKYCSIADGVTIYLGGNHRTEWVTTYPFTFVGDTWPEVSGVNGHPYSNGDVVIGNDVWLAHNCSIMSGVSIGDGAVVAAHALVTKSIPPYVIVGGNPAKILRQRFPDPIIKRLSAIRWWDWPEADIRKVVRLMVTSDIEAFCLAAEEIIRSRQAQKM